MRLRAEAAELPEAADPQGRAGGSSEAVNWSEVAPEVAEAVPEVAEAAEVVLDGQEAGQGLPLPAGRPCSGPRTPRPFLGPSQSSQSCRTERSP